MTYCSDSTPQVIYMVTIPVLVMAVLTVLYAIHGFREVKNDLA